jgi:hypothetical protein
MALRTDTNEEVRENVYFEESETFLCILGAEERVRRAEERVRRAEERVRMPRKGSGAPRKGSGAPRKGSFYEIRNAPECSPTEKKT